MARLIIRTIRYKYFMWRYRTMKKYRILYQSNSYTTEYFVKVKNEKVAEIKFREVKGNNPKIITIEEA